MTTIYRIRSKVSGLYSKGGYYPRFSKKGKIWSSIGALRNHFNLVDQGLYRDCEVVEYKLEEVEVCVLSLQKMMTETEEKRVRKEQLRKIELARLRAEIEQAEYLRLKEKYGG